MSDLKPRGVKAPLNLIPRDALCAIAGVLEHGNQKYSPWNFVDVSLPQAELDELHAALLRHTLASSDPTQDDHDDESGIHHLAHAGACILIMLCKLGIGYTPSKLLTVAWEDVKEARTMKGIDYGFVPQPGPQADFMHSSLQPGGKPQRITLVSLVAALQFYADEANWKERRMQPPEGSTASAAPIPSLVASDRGKQAKEALREAGA